jgi:hypothetical protein
MDGEKSGVEQVEIGIAYCVERSGYKALQWRGHLILVRASARA